MSLNIIDLIKGQLGPALVTQAASHLGESESGIAKAISGLLPAVIGGLANNSNNTNVLDSISNPSSQGILGNLLGLASNNNTSVVSGLLTSIFGDKVGGLVNSIATYAGISNNSSASLLNLVTGATVGSIGKYASDNNLDKSGISNLLSEQKGILSTLLPAGLSLASLNLGNMFGGDTTQKVNVTTPETPKPRVEVTRGTNQSEVFNDRNNNNNEGGGSIWKWLLPLLLAVVAAFFLWKQCEKKETTTNIVDNDTTIVDRDTVATNTTTTTPVTRVDENIDLNGVALKGYKGGMEDRMIAFLKSDGYKNAADDEALKTTWYDFDHVNFKMGSSKELEANSQGQLDNLLAILKAFPDAKVKIGGYTDKVGDEANNVKLSKERAEFIKNWLSSKGVGAQVLGADGYGSEFATVATSASDEERAVDRKMSVRFAK
ncbi:DUF937 domain-containing protein [Chryseobacterium sp.]|uniref:DUF937 domain-containing protein n=1 Tax=Chryseobacterium sp. TaxID=1871047 RepID=UPI003890F114